MFHQLFFSEYTKNVGSECVAFHYVNLTQIRSFRRQVKRVPVAPLIETSSWWKVLVPIYLYWLNYTKFGQLILMKIIKIAATRWHILKLK